jgi:ferritin-like metal-binding protein YciE
VSAEFRNRQAAGWYHALIILQEGIMAENGLRELYLDELRDLYNAENQLLKALPKMAKAANSDELRDGFEQHLEQTKGHVERLEQIFEALGESPKGKKCAGMEGLVKEGSEVMEEDFEGAVMDAALIGAAQRVEHYEIAAYGTVIAFAEQLGESEHVSLLKETLEEEKETDEKLTTLSEEINAQANSESDESSDEDEEGQEELDAQSDSTAKKRGRKSPKRAA